MNTIIVMILAAVAGLVAVSQYYAYAPVSASDKLKYQYMTLAFSVAALSVTTILLQVLYPHPACFLLYGFEKFIRILIMGSTILITEDMVDVDLKYISAFISVISYAAIALFFTDIMMSSEGQLTEGVLGVYYKPEASWHQALYYIYYIFYVVILITFIVCRATTVYRKCEKHDLVLLLLVYSFSAAGFLAEQFIITYSMRYIPIVILFSLISLIILRQLLMYHDSITLSRDHYKNELDSGRTDVVLILDNRLKVVYQNKRAEVLAQMYDDNYLGRKLSDIFTLSSNAYSQLFQNGLENAFGIVADYPANNRHVNMIVSHKYDKYGEILSMTVFVYNMEDLEQEESIVNDVSEENGEVMIQNATSITRDARVLIVDDDVRFLNVFQRILKPYEVSVTRAVSGRDALTLVSNHVFDIIFISYEMENGNGARTAAGIRNIGGEVCSRVPIIFTTTADINDVFTGFLEAGFNDYLEKPISKRSLNSVLTRWLWMRFENEDPEEVPADNMFSAHYNELNTLADDAEHMYSEHKYEMLGFCVKGIEKDSRRIGLNDIADLSEELEEAIMFEDIERIGQLFGKLRIGIRDAVTIR